MSRACPRFVEFVEEGVTSGEELLRVAHEYLDPVSDAGVDTLVLGCTHYPLLTGVISYVMGDDVTLVSSAEETAKDVYRTLVARDLLRDPSLPGAGPLVPGDRRPRGVRHAGPALPRPGDRRGGVGVRPHGPPRLHPRLTGVGERTPVAAPRRAVGG